MENAIDTLAYVPSSRATPDEFERMTLNLVIFGGEYASTDTLVVLEADLPLESFTVVFTGTVPEAEMTEDVIVVPEYERPCISVTTDVIVDE
jgi:hypothetical protein